MPGTVSKSGYVLVTNVEQFRADVPVDDNVILAIVDALGIKKRMSHLDDEAFKKMKIRSILVYREPNQS